MTDKLFTQSEVDATVAAAEEATVLACSIAACEWIMDPHTGDLTNASKPGDVINGNYIDDSLERNQ